MKKVIQQFSDRGKMKADTETYLARSIIQIKIEIFSNATTQ